MQSTRERSALFQHQPFKAGAHHFIKATERKMSLTGGHCALQNAQWLIQHDVHPHNTQRACHIILRDMIRLSQLVGLAGSAVL